jgi:hypothetical protein
MTRCFCLVLFAALAALAGAWSAAPPTAAKAKYDSSPVRPAPMMETLADKLMKRVDFPGVDDPKTTLSEVLDKLAKDYRVAFDVNERAFKFEMLNDVLKTEVANPNAIPPMKARLDTVLRKVLQRIDVPSGATWLVREDAIEITTEQFLITEVYLGGQRDLSSRAAEFEEDPAVYTGPRFPLIQADLRGEIPLCDALDRLAEQSDTTIVLDSSLQAEKSKMRVSLKGRNLPLDTAVLMLASMAGLDFVQLDNALFVTTPAKAAALKKTHALRRPVRKGKESDEERLLKKEEELTDRIGRMILEGKLKTRPKGE